MERRHCTTGPDHAAPPSRYRPLQNAWDCAIKAPLLLSPGGGFSNGAIFRNLRLRDCRDSGSGSLRIHTKPQSRIWQIHLNTEHARREDCPDLKSRKGQLLLPLTYLTSPSHFFQAQALAAPNATASPHKNSPQIVVSLRSGPSPVSCQTPAVVSSPNRQIWESEEVLEAATSTTNFLASRAPIPASPTALPPALIDRQPERTRSANIEHHSTSHLHVRSDCEPLTSHAPHTLDGCLGRPRAGNGPPSALGVPLLLCARLSFSHDTPPSVPLDHGWS
jgi:hypothetical protein